MKVDVYLNVNDGCVSVRSRETGDYGRVVSSPSKVTVADAGFVVQPGGWRKCRETGTKNVHALVRGEWNDAAKVNAGTRITYNPFEYYTFVTEDGRPVVSAEAATITTRGVFARGVTYMKSIKFDGPGPKDAVYADYENGEWIRREYDRPFSEAAMDVLFAAPWVSVEYVEA